jgi:hypothetical protein
VFLGNQYNALPVKARDGVSNANERLSLLLAFFEGASPILQGGIGAQSRFMQRMFLCATDYGTENYSEGKPSKKKQAAVFATAAQIFQRCGINRSH